MPGRGDGSSSERRPRQPANAGRRKGPAGPGAGPRKPGGIRLRRIGGDDFALDHPKCVLEMELDYVEGLEIWKAGDPEGARDALRYALQGCGDNLWVHVALGRIAFEEFKDPSLARGHFGYAFELAQRALPPGFPGRLPRDRDANRPFYDAIEGLSACYEALGKPAEAASLRQLAARLEGGRPRNRPPGNRPAPPAST